MSGITVRSRERPIYTTGRKVCSDLRRKFQHKVGTFNTHRKHCATSTLSQCRRFASALLTQAETAGARAGKQPAKGLASGLPTLVGTFDTCARRTQHLDFRLTSGLPTFTVFAQHVGSSDPRRDFRHQKSQKVNLSAREVLECF
jgi:hypothetical protein